MDFSRCYQCCAIFQGFIMKYQKPRLKACAKSLFKKMLDTPTKSKIELKTNNGSINAQF